MSQKELILNEQEIAKIQEYVKEQVLKHGIHIINEEKITIIHLFNITSMDFVFTRFKDGFKNTFSLVIHANGIKYFIIFKVEKENGKLITKAIYYSIQG